MNVHCARTMRTLFTLLPLPVRTVLLLHRRMSAADFFFLLCCSLLGGLVRFLQRSMFSHFAFSFWIQLIKMSVHMIVVLHIHIGIIVRMTLCIVIVHTIHMKFKQLRAFRHAGS